MLVQCAPEFLCAHRRACPGVNPHAALLQQNVVMVVARGLLAFVRDQYVIHRPFELEILRARSLAGASARDDIQGIYQRWRLFRRPVGAQAPVNRFQRVRNRARNTLPRSEQGFALRQQMVDVPQGTGLQRSGRIGNRPQRTQLAASGWDRGIRVRRSG